MSARALILNTMAGGLIGIINITVAISIAALMFAGTKPEYFASGVLMLLVGTVVSGLGGTLASGLPGVIVAPRSGLAPVFAGLVGGVVGTMPASGQQAAILPTIVMAVMITAFLTGTVLLMLGHLRLGRLVRYIPYPVMGGFFAGIGFVFVQGGLSVASGESVSIDKLNGLLTTDILLRTAPAIIFGITLYWVQRRWGHWTVFPLFLTLGFGAFYVALHVGDWTRADAIANGWLPLVPAMEIGLPLLDTSALTIVDWSAVAAQWASIATVALLSAIMLLLDTSGIEIITERELDPNEELKVVGITNMCNGLAGGYPGVHAATDTAFTYKLGGTQRLTGIVYAAVILLAIMAGMGFVQAIPTFILGGLLLYIGIDFLVSWTWETRRGLPLHDYAVILLILTVIAAVGILAGVGFGLIVAVVLFVVTYSRLTVIKSEMDGSEHGSHVDRDPACRQLLDREGHQIWIMRLQGFIFFGSTDQFAEKIKDRVSNQSGRIPIRYLVLDFRHVSQLDTSAVQAFRKLTQLSEKESVHIVLTEVTEKLRTELEKVGFFKDDHSAARRLVLPQLDDGVAWCEDQILGIQGHEPGRCEGSLESRLIKLLGDSAAAKEIVPLFEPLKVQQGNYLFREGEDGDCMYLVESAVAAVVVNSSDGRERVVRIFKEGAIVGELALYTGTPRIASVRVEQSGTLFKLDAEHMDIMQESHPRAARLFHAFVVKLLADKLNRATKELKHYT